MAAAGMQPMATMPYSRHVPRYSADVFFGENGFKLMKVQDEHGHDGAPVG